MPKIESRLARAMGDLLERDKRTADSQIEVIDNNGVITLIGVALSHAARSAAAEIVAHQPGVMGLINDLEVIDPDATNEVAVVLPLPTNLPYLGS